MVKFFLVRKNGTPTRYASLHLFRIFENSSEKEILALNTCFGVRATVLLKQLNGSGPEDMRADKSINVPSDYHTNAPSMEGRMRRIRASHGVMLLFKST